ncbi:MAG: alpha/beta hydrolase [Pseudooceanicola sp.]|nr:alpha/beta hydrolase [Pseudooceanicola sp.]
MEWSATPKARLEIGGKALEYACYGPAPDKAPTIVMLHEGLGCLALWRDFPERVAQATGLGVFVFSRAGYGQSDPVDLPRPLDFMTREAVQVLPKVLDAIGARKVILFGHSDGATIAAIHAGSVEDFRVRGLIVMAPHFFTEPMGLAAIAEAKAAYEGGGLRDKLAKYHRDPEVAFRGWNGVWLDPGFEAWNVADVIDYIRLPILAIQGRDDQYGTLAQVHEIEARSYAPVDLVVIDGCRHAPHLEAPERVLAEVTEYCARLERIEAAEVETA